MSAIDFDFQGRFDTNLRIAPPDSDGDIRIEIYEHSNGADQVAEIYIPRDDIPDLIAELAKTLTQAVPAPPTRRPENAL